MHTHGIYGNRSSRAYTASVAIDTMYMDVELGVVCNGKQVTRASIVPLINYASNFKETAVSIMYHCN